MEETKEVKMSPKKKTQASLMPALVGGIVGALVLAGIILYVVVTMQVKQLSESPFILRASGILHIPVATVNGSPILYAEYVDDKNTLERFYEQAPEGFPPVSGDDTSDMALSRLVATRLVMDVSEQFDVVVSDEDIAEKRAELISNFPSEADAIAEIEKAYGWTLETYSEKVIVPIIREEKLKEAFEASEQAGENAAMQQEVKARHILFRVEEDTEEEIARQLAQDVLDRLNAGEDFAALAAEFGSDGTKDIGGDLGWFGRGVMVPEFEEAAFALGPGELVKEPVKTLFGYHLIRVDDTRTVRDFVAFMDGQLEGADIQVLLPVNNPFELLEAPAENIDLGAMEEEGEVMQ
ncbi:MAG: hypothetical protein COU33_05400 [Candidatus Magasanikbacteria bacterium CG10_big_fil_rev_8_21_14_0_10_43_6]|uniref:PpiC domain-containing protein n=1 Tax=Candidatus Magasanikbacteria bacterium CG10_big_fil_rev_8_21_14_0_10_43_6 TaxID=1974650 RepID=A0A2M6VZQ9_9BACT|nr:MAG: hypothetical protein COU33_05400 [Candidatus Magasanikbacteria bacterium CG10_big_fil_rev_8_21_14_0_10_43_6]